MTPTKSPERLAFERETLALLQPLHRAALHLCRDPEWARDLVQETYLKAYRSFHQYQAGTNLRGWTFTVMYSVFYDACRSHARQRKGAEQLLHELHVHDADHAAAADALPLDGPVTLLETAQRPDWASAEVDAALAGLATPYRVAVLLVDVGELAYEDAARVIGCPVGTLRSRLFRARRLLAQALQGYAATEGYGLQEQRA